MEQSEQITPTNDSSSNTIAAFYGVWANKNVELVRTSKYFLLFERVDGVLTATIKKVNESGNKITYKTLAVANFDASNKSASVKTNKLLKKHYIVEYTSNKIAIKCEGNIVEELSLYDNKLILLTDDNKRQELELVEKITIVEPCNNTFANKDNIGKCLQEWALGSIFDYYLGGIGWEIVINTNKHSYIFSFVKYLWGGFIYCRAARIRSNNEGTVFAQNIRLMKNTSPKEFTAYMTENNLEITNKEIVISNSIFNPNACVFDKDQIYWSLKSYDGNKIILHGCQKDYKWKRPQKISIQKKEWFEYKDYDV